MVAQYAVATSKALEVILWLANERPGIDIYHIVKAAYFADRQHVNDHGRPIFGENYQADRYGPKGSAVYGLLQNDPLEQLALGSNGPLPFTVDPRGWSVRADRGANEALLSKSDVDALRKALNHVADLSFAELVEITHDDPAYRAANGGRMRYEDMLDWNDPEHEALAEELSDSSRHMVF